MANTREAAIKVTLKRGAFSSGLRSMLDESRTIGSRMGSALSGPMKQGLSAGVGTIKEIGSQLAGVIKLAGSIGGAFSITQGVTDAIRLRSEYKKLAVSIEAGRGHAMNFRNVQRQIEKAAGSTNRRHEELLSTVNAIGDRSDAAFALDNAENAGILMNALGADSRELGMLMAGLNTQFGISTKGMLTAVGTVTEAGARAGIPMEELSEDLKEMGTIARHAGLTGQRGLSVMMGMMEGMATHGGVKNMSETMTGLDQLFEKIRQKPVTEGLFKAFGKGKVSEEFFRAADGVERVKVLLEQAGKSAKFDQFFREALEVEFTGREEAAAFKTLAEPFRKAYEDARKQGLSTKEATEVATKAFDQNVAGMGKTASLTEDRLRKLSLSTTINDPQAKLRQAMNKISESLASPESLKAIDSLAQDLPKLASGISKLINFVVKNPLLAGAGFLGGRALLSAGGAAIPGLLGSAGRGVGGMFRRDFVNPRTAGASVQLGLAALSGNKAGVAMANAAIKQGKWAAAGQALGKAGGVTMAALVAYELGKAGIDATMGKELTDQNITQRTRASALAATGEGAGERQKRMMLRMARTRFEQMEKSGGPGLVQSVMGGLAHVATGGEVESAGMQFDTERAKLKATIAELESQLAKPSKSSEKAAGSLDKFTTAVEKAAGAVGKTAGTGASKGPLPTGGGRGSGAVPRPG